MPYLKLAAAVPIKSVKCISDSLDTVREIGKLVKAAFTRQTNVGQPVLANSNWCV